MRGRVLHGKYQLWYHECFHELHRRSSEKLTRPVVVSTRPPLTWRGRKWEVQTVRSERGQTHARFIPPGTSNNPFSWFACQNGRKRLSLLPALAHVFSLERCHNVNLPAVQEARHVLLCTRRRQLLTMPNGSVKFTNHTWSNMSVSHLGQKRTDTALVIQDRHTAFAVRQLVRVKFSRCANIEKAATVNSTWSARFQTRMGQVIGWFTFQQKTNSHLPEIFNSVTHHGNAWIAHRSNPPFSETRAKFWSVRIFFGKPKCLFAYLWTSSRWSVAKKAWLQDDASCEPNSTWKTCTNVGKHLLNLYVRCENDLVKRRFLLKKSKVTVLEKPRFGVTTCELAKEDCWRALIDEHHLNRRDFKSIDELTSYCT